MTGLKYINNTHYVVCYIPSVDGPKGIFVPMDLYDLHQPLASVIHHGKIAAEAGNP